MTNIENNKFVNKETTLIVQNIPPIKFNKTSIYNLFSSFGDVVNIELLNNTSKEYIKNSKSLSALVEFELQEDCDSAIFNINGYNCEGNYISVSYSKNKIKLHKDMAIWKEDDYYIKYNNEIASNIK